MANPGYVRSTDGSDGDDGSTWALANQTLAGADGDDSAGDTIYVSQSHAESTAGAVTLAFAGTAASPTKVICGNDGAEPPTAVATTATVATTGSNSISFNSAAQYIYGISFTAGNSNANANINHANTTGINRQTYEDCNFILGGTGSSNLIRVGNTDIRGAIVTFINCGVKFAHTSHSLRCYNDTFRWMGGSILSGGSTPTDLFTWSSSQSPAEALVNGVDFSNAGSGMNLVLGSSTASGRFLFCNCKLPSSWSGSLISGTVGVSQRAEMYNCDDGDTNYALWVADYSGSIRDETTIVRDDGASDGTTSFSWKMVTTANAEYPLIVLRSPEIRYWNETTGSAITLTVEIVHDSQGSGTSSAFTDKEIWLEAQYLGTSGFPLGSFIDDAAADVLASAADQTSSSVTWTTAGLSTPVKQKLSVTLTPQEKGVILLTVCMAITGIKTCYVCPKVTVS